MSVSPRANAPYLAIESIRTGLFTTPSACVNLFVDA